MFYDLSFLFFNLFVKKDLWLLVPKKVHNTKNQGYAKLLRCIISKKHIIVANVLYRDELHKTYDTHFLKTDDKMYLRYKKFKI